MIKLVDERTQLVREGDQIVVGRGNVAEGGSPAMNVATVGFLIGLLLGCPRSGAAGSIDEQYQATHAGTAQL
jgi:hypothetical protein